MADVVQLRLDSAKGTTPRSQGGEVRPSVVAGTAERDNSRGLVSERITVREVEIVRDYETTVASEGPRAKSPWTPKNVGRLIMGVGVLATTVVCIVIQSPSAVAVLALAGVAMAWFFRAEKSS